MAKQPGLSASGNGRRRRNSIKKIIQLVMALIVAGIIFFVYKTITDKPTMEKAREELRNGNTDRAVEMLTWLADEQNNPEAAKELGEIHYHGRGVTPNPIKAMGYLRVAASNGDTNAHNALAEIYMEGRGTPRNPRAAVPHLEHMAARGDSQAQFTLGQIFLEGDDGVDRNPVASVRYFNEAAENGVTEADAILGKTFFYGNGVDRNLSRAETHLKEALELNDPEIPYLLGQIHYDKRNYLQAFTNFKKASDMGHVAATTNLGNMYYYGLGTMPDPAKAVQYLTPLAQQGDAPSQALLAFIYFNGLAGRPDYERARDLATAAARTKEPAALGVLGAAYLRGNGLRQDTEKALENLTAAAQLGDAPSNRLLGEIYYTGEGGVAKDKDSAQYYLRRASELGDLSALDIMQRLISREEDEKRLAEEEKEKAEKLALEKRQIDEEASARAAAVVREREEALERAKKLWSERMEQVEQTEAQRAAEMQLRRETQNEARLQEIERLQQESQRTRKARNEQTPPKNE